MAIKKIKEFNMKKYFILILIVFCVSLSAQKTNEKKFKGNIEMKLTKFVDFVAQKTNSIIIYDQMLKGRNIFVGNLHWETADDLFDIFLSIIECNNFMAEIIKSKNRRIIKIKRNIQGPWTQTSIIKSSEALDKIKSQDIFVTMVIQLRYVSAREVQTNLRALRIVNPQGGNLVGIQTSNTLLITDVAPNVKRIYEIVKLIDCKEWIPKKSTPFYNAEFKIEKQTIPISYHENLNVMAQIDSGKSVSVTIMDKAGNVIASIEDNKTEIMLDSYIQKGGLLKFEIKTLKTEEVSTFTKIFTKIFYKGKKYSIWDFSIGRRLPANTVIRFALDFQKIGEKRKK